MNPEEENAEPTTHEGGEGASASPPASKGEVASPKASAVSTATTAAAKPKLRWIRYPVGWIFVALAVLLLTTSTLVVWSHRTLLNTNAFVNTVGPVFSHPEVDQAVATRVTAEIFDQLHLQKRIETALPKKVDFAAGPIVHVTEGVVSAQLAKVLESPQFQKAWNQILRTTHEALVKVLRGEKSAVVDASNGAVVINTVPLLNQALEQISGLISQLTGKHVTFPTITSTEVPQQAIDKVGAALGITLPSSFGQFTLVKSAQLKQIQQAVKKFDALTYALPVITLLCLGFALWLSYRRRRTLLQFFVGSALLMIILRRVVLYTEGIAASKANNPTVARTILDTVLHGFFVLTAWILALCVLGLVITLITGPYRWARALRRWVATGWHWLVGLFSPEHRGESARWLGRNAEALQLGGAIIGGILFFVVGVSWVSFLVIAALLLVYEIVLNVFKTRHGEEHALAESAGGAKPAS